MSIRILLLMILLLMFSFHSIECNADNRESETTTVNQEPFDPLDEGERLFRAFGTLLLGIVLLFLVAGTVIWIVRKAR